MNARSLRTRAFTLIELLVVISIVALMIAILLPALQSARETARNIACKSNLRQVALVYQIYMQDHDDYLIPSGGGWEHKMTNSNPRWDARVEDLLGAPDVLDCPSAVREHTPQISYAYTLVAWLANNPDLDTKRRRLQDFAEPEKQMMMIDCKPVAQYRGSPFTSIDPLNAAGARYRHMGDPGPAYSEGLANFFTLDFAIHSGGYEEINSLSGTKYRWFAWEHDPSDPR